jgi:hypothetical protein
MLWHPSSAWSHVCEAVDGGLPDRDEESVSQSSALVNSQWVHHRQCSAPGYLHFFQCVNGHGGQVYRALGETLTLCVKTRWNFSLMGFLTLAL